MQYAYMYAVSEQNFKTLLFNLKDKNDHKLKT